MIIQLAIWQTQNFPWLAIPFFIFAANLLNETGIVPGKEKEFETFFKDEYSVAMSKQPGFVSVTLLKEHEKEAVYQMVIRFQSLETAAAWRDSADHKALSPKIKALYKESTVQLYEVVA